MPVAAPPPPPSSHGQITALRFEFVVFTFEVVTKQSPGGNTKVCTGSDNFTQRVVCAKKNFNSGYRLHKFLPYDAYIHVRTSPILQAYLEQMARPNSNSKQHGRQYSPHAAYRVNYAQNKLPSPKVIDTRRTLLGSCSTVPYLKTRCQQFEHKYLA